MKLFKTLGGWVEPRPIVPPADVVKPPVPNCLIGRAFSAGKESGFVLGVLPGGDWYLIQLLDEKGGLGVQRLAPFEEMQGWFFGDPS